MKPKPRSEPMMIRRVIGRQVFEVTVSKALWGIWCIATRPLTILTGYLLFGWRGAVYATIITILNERGRL